MRVNVVVENKIPFIKGLLEDYCNVKYLAPEDITAEAMSQADALITRTRTRCDASLLAGSQCRFIATATIGTDHIDLDYCQRNGITVSNAPGCNAPAVAQYVMASILHWRRMRNDSRPLQSLTLGIVGVGHVGSIVEQWARQLGMKVLLCDPPRQKVECTNKFVSLSTIAQGSDIITFHTPLTRSGEYATYHMCDRSFIDNVNPETLIINSARGPIINTHDIIEALDNRLIADVAIDCWENEPHLSAELLSRAVIATPHIAGYSREGKIRATAMAVNAFTRFFGLPLVEMAERVKPGAAQCVTENAILESYNPFIDTASLKGNASAFEALRNNYNYRSEVAG